MSYLKVFIDSLPGIAQVLLGVAAIITAWKSRKIAKEKANEKRKDQGT